MTSLHDVIQNVITSNTLQNTEHQMFAITNKITHLQHDRQTYITPIKEKRTWIEKEVKDVRNFINDHLDRIQEKLMKELDEAEVKANRQAQILLKSMKEIKGEINEMKDNIDNMKKYASNLQTFLCMKQLESDVKKNEHQLQSLLGTSRIRPTIIQRRLNDTIKYFTSNVKTFGDVRLIEDKQSCNTPLGSQEHLASPMMVTNNPSIS